MDTNLPMNSQDPFAPTFELGKVVATRAIMALAERGLMWELYLTRHASGDWGDVSLEDSRANTEGISCGDRLLSAFNTPFGRIWIITESDRSSTCILLPQEY